MQNWENHKEQQAQEYKDVEARKILIEKNVGWNNDFWCHC